MARYRDSVCRLCRREGVKLFLKGPRCSSEKCAFDKRSYAPGMHGQGRSKLSDYGLQLREKQKTKRIYGVLETQFRNYFHYAERQQGITGNNLLVLLERRLDNTVYRLGLASSRSQARQLVRHAYFLVNGKKVSIPSYKVNSGDTITVHSKGREAVPILGAVKEAKGQPLSAWLQMDFKTLTGTVNNLPERQEIDVPVQEQLIVELYSK